MGSSAKCKPSLVTACCTCCWCCTASTSLPTNQEIYSLHPRDLSFYSWCRATRTRTCCRLHTRCFGRDERESKHAAESSKKTRRRERGDDNAPLQQHGAPSYGAPVEARSCHHASERGGHAAAKQLAAASLQGARASAAAAAAGRSCRGEHPTGALALLDAMLWTCETCANAARCLCIDSRSTRTPASRRRRTAAARAAARRKKRAGCPVATAPRRSIVVHRGRRRRWPAPRRRRLGAAAAAAAALAGALEQQRVGGAVVVAPGVGGAAAAGQQAPRCTAGRCRRRGGRGCPGLAVIAAAAGAPAAVNHAAAG